jgi:hypothetical protein
VNTGRNEVGVPLSVLLHAPDEELVGVTAASGLCAYVNAKQENSAEARRKLEGAMLVQSDRPRPEGSQMHYEILAKRLEYRRNIMMA